MALWVLVGVGVNDISIPALVWTNEQTALDACRYILGDKTKISTKGGVNSYSWDVSEDKAREVCKGLYTHYYDGCGGFYRLELKQVEEGQPFVSWDLD